MSIKSKKRGVEAYAKPDESNPKEYDVGYGKPPKATQFKKGQSGNPHGRPLKPFRSKPELWHGISSSAFEKGIYRPYKIIENGKETEVTAIDAVIRSMIVGAIRGNRLSQQFLFKAVREQEEESMRSRIAHYDNCKKLKDRGERILADAKKAGKEPEEFYPHPDDIILSGDTFDVKILGPLNFEEAKRYKYYKRLRDCVFMADLRYRGIGEGMDAWLARTADTKGVSVGQYFAALVDKFLPLRMRMTEIHQINLALQAARYKPREWEKWYADEQAWLNANEPPKDSSITPEVMKKYDKILERIFKKKKSDSSAGNKT